MHPLQWSAGIWKTRIGDGDIPSQLEAAEATSTQGRTRCACRALRQPAHHLAGRVRAARAYDDLAAILIDHGKARAAALPPDLANRAALAVRLDDRMADGGIMLKGEMVSSVMSGAPDGPLSFRSNT